MKKKAHELEFISQIKRDGSGTEKVPEKYLKSMLENPLMKDEYFELNCLSMSENTFIAINFNSFIVKLLPEVKEENENELWDDVQRIIEQGDRSLGTSIAYLKSKFTIKRK